MVRIRSPNYPAIGLSDAIQRVSQVFEKEHQHPAPKEVVVRGMGYNSVNGASLGALSALVKFGLLVKDGGDYRVSDWAMQILHPQSPEERSQAVLAAARQPTLFAEIAEHFEGSSPSDDNLRAYLIRHGFGKSALSHVIQSYRDTIDLAFRETGGYAPEETQTRTKRLDVEPGRAQPSGGFNYVSQLGESTIRVSFTGDRLDVEAGLLDGESVDRLIEALQANKPLLPEKPAKIGKFELADDGQGGGDNDQTLDQPGKPDAGSPHSPGEPSIEADES